MKNWKEELKERANSIWGKAKEELVNFNGRSLWNKLFIMALIHFTLRFILGGKTESNND
jgi:hypothetical protein